jgi:hypothetical protein
VERLWTNHGMIFFFRAFPPETADRIPSRLASYDASLASPSHACDSLVVVFVQPASVTTSSVTHRYEEKIAGRTYEIEVRPVSKSQWRAQIARRPGMPTSLMPFYGPTPEEAAQELRRWLALVYNGITKQ